MKKYMLIIAAAVLSVSCANMLNTAPVDEIVSENMWTSETLCEQGIYGLYENFRQNTSTSDHIYEQYGWFYSNLFQIVESQSMYMSDFGVLSALSKSAGLGQFVYCWRWAYTGIHRCNEAIANLHKGGLDEDKFERYMCEALFLRAWYYSYLNKVFDKVPIYLEPVNNADCTKSESSAVEVWNQVVEDLTYCIENEHFPNNTLSATDYGRASKGAAYALRGMAYMWLAWENGEDTGYYQLAANDLEKISDCGYRLWQGDYIDFFKAENETDAEMIFPVQYGSVSGYTDNFQKILAPADCYNGWTEIRPTYGFVTSFQNADGSEFKWTDVIPEWDDDVFKEDVARREVFFLRDSICIDDSGNVLRDYVDPDGNTTSRYWGLSAVGNIQERIEKIGLDIFKKYYHRDYGDESGEGNEDRIRRAFENRDPRLKEIVITPYDRYTVYAAEYNNAKEVTKELRWPQVLTEQKDGGDLYFTGRLQMYLYKKYVCNRQGQIANRDECDTDWPLIRFTDMYLYLAECYVHLGKLSEAVGIVNEIRARAGMPDVAAGTADEVMEAVRYERRVELCLEGQNWFDEWRWGTYKDTKYQGLDEYGTATMWGEFEGVYITWRYSDTMYPWPIPKDECERNSNLTRTPGWVY